MPRKRRSTARELLLLALPILAVALIFASRRFYTPPHPIAGNWQLAAGPDAVGGAAALHDTLSFDANGVFVQHSVSNWGHDDTVEFRTLDEHSIRKTIVSRGRARPLVASPSTEILPYVLDRDTLRVTFPRGRRPRDLVLTYKRKHNP